MTIVQNKREQQGLLDYVTPTKTYLDLILDLRNDVELKELAESLEMPSIDLANLLSRKGFDIHGYPIHDNRGRLDNDYTPITPDVRELLKKGLKQGLDTEVLIEYYKLSRTQGSGLILELKREIKAEGSKLYPLNELNGTRGKYSTMITITKD